MEVRNSAEHNLASCCGGWVLYALLAMWKRLQQLKTGNAQSPNAWFHIWNVEQGYALGTSQKMRGRNWHRLSWIWAFVGWKKVWEKSTSLQQQIVLLRPPTGTPCCAVHFLASMPWELSRNTVLENRGVQLSPAPGLFLGIPSQVHCLSLFQSHRPLLYACGH